MHRALLIVPLGGLLVLFGAWSTPPLAAQDGNVGFVEFRVNTLDPIPFLDTYLGENEEPYPNFNAIMRALEIPVHFDAGLGSALGFLPDGRTRFNLNLGRKQVLIGNNTLPLEPGHFRIVEQKLYVRHSVVAAWFPLRMDWNTEAYRLTAHTRYVLPSEDKKRRATRRKALEENQSASYTAEELERTIPWFDPGMFELSTTLSGGDGYADGGLLSLKGVHRFLKGDLEYSVTQGHFDGKTRDANIDYSRLTYYDPLRTWQVRFGDTFATFSPLIAGTQSFRGASFYTGGRRLRFGRTTLIGTAPIGSEVDLYRLGVLVDFTSVDDKGFYRFENVPLSLRTTRFEARIFTPSGRQLHHFHDVSSQEEMLPGGDLATTGALGRGRQTNFNFTLAGSEARFGLTEGLTLGAYVIALEDYVASFDLIEKQTNAGSFLLLRPVEWLVLLGEQAQSREEEGTAQRMNAFFALGSFSLGVDQQTFDGFYAPPKRPRSIVFVLPARAEESTQVQARARLFAININLSTTSIDFGESRNTVRDVIRLDRRLTRNLGLTLTNRQEHSSEEGQDDSGTNTSEALATYNLTSLSRLELRGRTTKEIGFDPMTLYRATWQKNHRLDSPWSYRLTYITITDQEDFGQAELGYLFSNNIRFKANVDTDDRWLLQATYALPFRISGEGFETFEPEHFGRAGLTGTVFVDANGNGLRDAGEPVMPDVEMMAPGADNLVSNEKGVFRGWGVTTHSPTSLEMDLLTTDALYLPTRQRTPIAPRPGEIMEVDIPLVPGSGLEGRLAARTIHGTSPANGLEMQLVNTHGDVIASSRVEFDGTFLFENIPPGVYLLHGNPDEMKRRGLHTLPAEQTLIMAAGVEPVWLQLRDMVLLRDTDR